MQQTHILQSLKPSGREIKSSSAKTTTIRRSAKMTVSPAVRCTRRRSKVPVIAVDGVHEFVQIATHQASPSIHVFLLTQLSDGQKMR